MTVLEIAQDISSEIALARPSTLVDSSDAVGRQLKGLMDETAEEMVSSVPWNENIAEFTITLVSGQASYNIPFDSDRFISDTVWNTDSSWPLYGNLTPQEFGLEKYGIIASSPWQRFRFAGFADAKDELGDISPNKSLTKIVITPTPTAAEAGEIITFQYYSDRAFRPKSWDDGQAYSAQTKVYNGTEYLYNASSGTSGGTKPTSANSYNDGSVQWSLYTGSYSRIQKDSDEFRLDLRLFKMGVKWRFLLSRGMAFESFKAIYDERLRRLVGQKSLSPVLDLSFDYSARKRGRIPDSGIGF
jgi:hypothetical protein